MEDNKTKKSTQSWFLEAVYCRNTCASPVRLLLVLGLALSFSCQSRTSSPEMVVLSKPPADSSSKVKVLPLRYRPEGQDIVIENGTKRFNRALYGTNTGFRVEAGDLPEFLLYMPNKGGNLKLGIASRQGNKWIIEADHIKAIYRAGSMLYEIRDPLLGQGTLHLHLLAMDDADGMLLSVEAISNTTPFELIWAYGGASGHRPNRDGDLGADPEEGFYLHPEHALGNTFRLRRPAFELDFKIKDKQHTLLGLVPQTSTMALADARQQESPVQLLTSKPSDTPVVVGSLAVQNGKKLFFAVQSQKYPPKRLQDLPAAFAKAEASRVRLSNQIKIETPDPFFNTVGGALSIAADAIYEHPSYMHGAIAWRMPLNGWRGAYVADVLGWHDRARAHFRAYNKVQVLEPAWGPVVPDPERAWARQEEKIGNSLYTRGYISRSPTSRIVAHHYDMNLVYIDQLLRHFNWTGDTTFLREVWPVLERHLAWEKRNFDSNNDGLYDAYAAIWASDALQYSGGGVTHTSAYNLYANKTAARFAKLIGKNPAPYEEEAAKIAQAVQQHLWLPEKGWYAEYKDLLGRQEQHPSAGVWTVYHALDSEVPDPFQAYTTLRYVDRHIPHASFTCAELPGKEFSIISTTNWMPYTWSINNVALGEVAHTALAYWQAGRVQEANHLLQSNLFQSMFLGSSPGNFQQLSSFDHFRDELYRDFADGIGITSRAIVEGMFGLQPDVLAGELRVRPGLPAEWKHASLQTPDIRYNFKREGQTETYTIEPKFKQPLRLRLKVAALRDQVAAVTVNGQPVEWQAVEAVGRPQIEIAPAQASPSYDVRITWSGQEIANIDYPSVVALTSSLWFKTGEATLVEIKDPQNVLQLPDPHSSTIFPRVVAGEGDRTLFLRLKQGDLEWWQPVDMELRKPFQIRQADQQNGEQLLFTIENNTAEDYRGEATISTRDHAKKLTLHMPAFGQSEAIALPAAALYPGSNQVRVRLENRRETVATLVNWQLPINPEREIKWEPQDLTAHFNDRVTQIFQNRYESPRPQSATLQLPLQGIGNWCYPLVTFDVNDTGLRQKAGSAGLFTLPNGLLFRTPGPGDSNNILFTSQWDNYPVQASVPLKGKAKHAYLLMAGSTNPMQSRFTNGEVVVQYTDGTEERLVLENPSNWWPIEQDFHIDDFAFSIDQPKPLRVHLQTGEAPQEFKNYESIKGFSSMGVPGGAANVLDLPLNPKKNLASLKVETWANDVVIGLMGVTLVR